MSAETIESIQDYDIKEIQYIFENDNQEKKKVIVSLLYKEYEDSFLRSRINDNLLFSLNFQCRWIHII